MKACSRQTGLKVRQAQGEQLYIYVKVLLYQPCCFFSGGPQPNKQRRTINDETIQCRHSVWEYHINWLGLSFYSLLPPSATYPFTSPNPSKYACVFINKFISWVFNKREKMQCKLELLSDTRLIAFYCRLQLRSLHKCTSRIYYCLSLWQLGEGSLLKKIDPHFMNMMKNANNATKTTLLTLVGQELRRR